MFLRSEFSNVFYLYVPIIYSRVSIIEQLCQVVIDHLSGTCVKEDLFIER